MGKVTTYEAQRYRHLPTVVAGILFDGTTACAEAIMAWAPGKFMYDDYGRLCTHTPEGLRYVHEGNTAMLDVEGLPYSVRESIMVSSYVPFEAGYTAPLTPARVNELQAEAHATGDVGRLREIVDALVAHGQALQA